jgi:hypothetical protein
MQQQLATYFERFFSSRCNGSLPLYHGISGFDSLRER